MICPAKDRDGYWFAMGGTAARRGSGCDDHGLFRPRRRPVTGRARSFVTFRTAIVRSGQRDLRRCCSAATLLPGWI